MPVPAPHALDRALEVPGELAAVVGRGGVHGEGEHGPPSEGWRRPSRVPTMPPMTDNDTLTAPPRTARSAEADPLPAGPLRLRRRAPCGRKHPLLPSRGTCRRRPT